MEWKNYRTCHGQRFFSKGNIQGTLLHEHIPFYHASYHDTKKHQGAYDQGTKNMKTQSISINLTRNRYLVKPVIIEEVGKKTEEEDSSINGYCFYDSKKKMEEKNAFYSQLYDVKEELEKTAISK